jgi:hypothetical protein
MFAERPGRKVRNVLQRAPTYTAEHNFTSPSLQQLIVPPLVKKFLFLYEARRFITEFTTAHHLPAH